MFNLIHYKARETKPWRIGLAGSFSNLVKYCWFACGLAMAWREEWQRRIPPPTFLARCRSACEDGDVNGHLNLKQDSAGTMYLKINEYLTSKLLLYSSVLAFVKLCWSITCHKYFLLHNVTFTSKVLTAENIVPGHNSHRSPYKQVEQVERNGLDNDTNHLR